jgi:hypothetical protein
MRNSSDSVGRRLSSATFDGIEILAGRSEVHAGLPDDEIFEGVDLRHVPFEGQGACRE